MATWTTTSRAAFAATAQARASGVLGHAQINARHFRERLSRWVTWRLRGHPGDWALARLGGDLAAYRSYLLWSGAGMPPLDAVRLAAAHSGVGLGGDDLGRAALALAAGGLSPKTCCTRASGPPAASPSPRPGFSAASAQPRR